MVLSYFETTSVNSLRTWSQIKFKGQNILSSSNQRRDRNANPTQGNTSDRFASASSLKMIFMERTTSTSIQEKAVQQQQQRAIDQFNEQTRETILTTPRNLSKSSSVSAYTNFLPDFIFYHKSECNNFIGNSVSNYIVDSLHYESG